MKNKEDMYELIDPDEKEHKTFKLWEKILIISSLVFIIGCMIFYGSRLIKYYKIYNPKIEGESVELIMNAIVRNQPIVYEKDGLYRTSGMYIYKGENVDNYIRYSNMLWRIVKFNIDGSLDLVLDGNINMLKWNNDVVSFEKSDIYKYLNNYFYKLLDYDNLSNTVICTDEIDDLKNITCNNKITDSYVRLLSISEYLNSMADNKTYINDSSNIWLSDRGSKTIWNINDKNLSSSKPSNMYYVKPVITLKNSTVLKGGTGKVDDPYIVGDSKLGVGSYVKLNDDVWYIYDIKNDTYLLSLSKELDGKKAFSKKSTKFDITDKTSLAYYLNNEYYESLAYKDILEENDWYNGSYDSYNDVFSSTTKSYVGLLNVSDIKKEGLIDYYLMTASNNDKIYLYSDTLINSKPNLLRNVVPTIAIKNLKASNGAGTDTNPYEVTK
ncbi:MAG: hypothetical protein MR227_01475 [Firmicutes bacterium]|nr:hypothetical protein [Bacillota bacterium]